MDLHRELEHFETIKKRLLRMINRHIKCVQNFAGLNLQQYTEAEQITAQARDKWISLYNKSLKSIKDQTEGN